MQLIAVGVIAGLSALGAALAGMSPTGLLAADVLWSMALGATVAVAGSLAKRWTLLVCAAIATLSAAGWLVFVALAALGLSVWVASREHRDRVLGSAIAGLSVQTLVRIDDWSWAPVGASAVVAAVAMGLVVVSGWRNASMPWRRRTALASAGVAAAMAVFTLVFAVAGAITYPGVRNGVVSARDGVEAARVDERQAATLFRRASDQLEGALTWLDNPLMAPVRLVPGAAQQARAVVAGTTTARDLALTAAEGAALVERDELRPVDGRIDTDAVASLADPLQAAVDALDRASAELASLASPWLVAPLADRLGELQQSVAEAGPGTELALQGAQVVPGMAGGDGPRRWLMLVGTPAESRLLGGFVGNWAVIEAANGAFDVVEDGSAAELNNQLAVDERRVDASQEYRDRYSRYSPDRFFQNTSASPDFPSAARVASSFYTQSTGKPVEGVIYVDPISLGALVDLGGPVRIPTLDRTFTGAQLAQFLLVDLYNFDEDTQDEIFSEALDGAVDGLTDGALPGPGVIADAMSVMAAEGRIMMWSPVPAEEEFFVALGIDGALPVNDGQDFVFVGLANQGPNKIDTYLRRDVTYNASYDPLTGVTSATATLVLTNEAPEGLPPVVIGNDDGLPERTARTFVSLYSPLVARNFTVNGVTSGLQLQAELGWSAWSTTVDVPPGGRLVLKWSLEGRLAPGEYRIMWRPQPLVIPPTLDLDVGITNAPVTQPSLLRVGLAPTRFDEVLQPVNRRR